MQERYNICEVASKNNLDLDALSSINQYEQQILIHSIIYYRLGTSIWVDKTFDIRAKELKRMIEDHPTEFQHSILFDDFKDFDWVSGYDLPIYDSHYTKIAQWMVERSGV